jgi:hypothetical protein
MSIFTTASGTDVSFSMKYVWTGVKLPVTGSITMSYPKPEEAGYLWITSNIIAPVIDALTSIPPSGLLPTAKQPKFQ